MSNNFDQDLWNALMGCNGKIAFQYNLIRAVLRLAAAVESKPTKANLPRERKHKPKQIAEEYL